MQCKRTFDTDAHFFEEINRHLAQPEKCRRRDVESVAEQADAFSELEAEKERYAGKRMMVTLSHPCGDDEDSDDLCDCSLYDQIRTRDDLKTKVAAVFLANYFGTPKLEFDEVDIPDTANIFALFLDEPFCERSAHEVAYLLQTSVARLVFFVETDTVTALVARYAAEFRRLDRQFHCRALAADLERWEAPPHELGPADPLLVAEHYGNAFRQQHVPQPSVRRFLVPKPATA